MSAAEEAIARAKAIAARLAGTGATVSTTPEQQNAASSSSLVNPSGVGGGVADGQVDAVAEAALAAAFGQGSKRRRWGTEDASNNNNSSTSDALAIAMSTKRHKAGSSSSTDSSKKIWIPVDKNPGYNYIGLLIGPGGSKQRELVEQSGGNVKISVRGRGSSSSAPVPGQPEEPLHVLLEGHPDNVATAESLVSELLNDSTKAQAEKERQLAVVSASKGGGGGSGTEGGTSTSSSSLTTYQPKPVAQLLGLNGGGHYGPSSGDSSQVIEEKIGVPNGVVGYIIGKGGESITSMQRKSECRVQIQKEHEMEPGTTNRTITLTAATQESINACRSIIEDMVRERLRLNDEQQGGGRMSGYMSSGPGANASQQAAQLQLALADGHTHVTVTVPNNDVGLIIGKGGSTIRSIQDRSGANVQIPQGPDPGNPMIRTVNITHQQKEGAEFAKTLIEEIMNSKTHHHSNNHHSNGVSIQIQIPDKDVGMCIGKAGCVIREMQARTQTRIQIPSQPTPGQPHRVANVSGSAEGCQKVQEIINRIILEQSSQFVMAGAAFQAHPQQHQQYGQQHQQYGQQHQQQAQPDYSAQWAAYYASIGQTGTQAINSAPVAAAPAAAAAAAGNQGQQHAPDHFYDDFFRYSYHYGEDAARQYYGAWSPPVGSVNPYGTNPAGTKSAAAAPKNENEQTDSNGQDAANIRDSSVRNVSNLPAWMTKS